MLISVTGEAKYAKQTGGRGQYGHVVLRLTLHDASGGVQFVNRLGDLFPAAFIPAVEGGVRAFVADGHLARQGYSSGVVELIDGSWHDSDSSDLAFHTAAVMAMEDALRHLPRDWESEGEDSPGVREPRSPLRPRPASSIALPEPQDDSD